MAFKFIVPLHLLLFEVRLEKSVELFLLDARHSEEQRWVIALADDSDGLGVEIAHLDLKDLLEVAGHHRTEFDRDLLLLASQNAALTWVALQVVLTVDASIYHLELERHFARILQVKLLGDDVAEFDLAQLEQVV